MRMCYPDTDWLRRTTVRFWRMVPHRFKTSRFGSAPNRCVRCDRINLTRLRRPSERSAVRDVRR